MQIVFLRHGESESNAAGRWQGQGDSPLSSEGRRQIGLVADRLAGSSFDLVVGSDLGRARETAAALGMDQEADRSWREIDIGAWEGLTREEVRASFAGEIEALRAGEPVSLGGGEALAEFRGRVAEALDRLVARLHEGQRALVVTHGGVVREVVRSVLRLDPKRRSLGGSFNTSLTTLLGPRRLLRFNDAAHLGMPHQAPVGEEGATVVTLTRAGASDGDAPLTAAGLAELVARHAGLQVEVVAGGWAIRACLGEVLGLDRDSQERLALPDEGSVSRLVVTREGTTLGDYNLVPRS